MWPTRNMSASSRSSPVAPASAVSPNPARGPQKTRWPLSVAPATTSPIAQFRRRARASGGPPIPGGLLRGGGHTSPTARAPAELRFARQFHESSPSIKNPIIIRHDFLKKLARLGKDALMHARTRLSEEGERKR